MARIKGIRKIYAAGRHNAFTDMEYCKGYYYIAFRNVGGHGLIGSLEVLGKIIVIR